GKLARRRSAVEQRQPKPPTPFRTQIQLPSAHPACRPRARHQPRLKTSRALMREQETLERARRDREQGKAPSTQAGEFIREEMHHIREGKHGARSAKQAIAIGLSKARRAGVKLPPPRHGRVSEKTRNSAASAYRQGQRGQ